MKCRQWVVDIIHLQMSSLLRLKLLLPGLMLVAYCAREIDGGEQHKNICL